MSNLTLTQKTLKDGNGTTFSGEVGEDGSSNIYSLTVPLDQTGALLPQAAGTSGSNALPVQGVSGGVAVQVSAASLPLPAGAATSANQPALNGDGGALAHVTNFPVTQPVSGTVTANAGTNLNTSALALESGGNLATIAASALSQGSATSGQKGSLDMGAVTTSAPSYTTGQTSPLSLNTSGGLRVDGSGVTQPVSGTVTANAGSGTFGTNVAQVGGSAVSTAATGVQKVGVTGSAGAALDAAGQNAASPANELIVGGQFNTSPATITSGNVSPLQLDSSGNLKVNVAAGGASGGTSSSFSTTFPSTGTAIGAEYLSSAPTLTSGQMGALQLDSSGNLKVNVVVGGGGGSGGSAALSYSVAAQPALTTTTNAYAAGDVIGSSTTAGASGKGYQKLTFFRTTSQPTGVLKSVSLVMTGSETAQIQFYIFNQAPSNGSYTDGGAFSLNTTDATYLVTAPFTMTPVLTNGTVTAATANFDLPVMNHDTPSTLQYLYVIMVVAAGAATFTAGATDLNLTLHGIQD